MKGGGGGGVGRSHFNDYVFDKMMDPSVDGVVQFVALRDDRLELRLFQVRGFS